jgi:hypothetical protein
MSTSTPSFFGASSEDQIQMLDQSVKFDLSCQVNDTLQAMVDKRAAEMVNAERPYCPNCNCQPKGLTMAEGQRTKCNNCGSFVSMVKLPELLEMMRLGYDNARRDLKKARDDTNAAKMELARQVEENRKAARESSESRDLYFHPATNKFCNMSETTNVGILGRIRIGWVGPVYRIFDEQERAKMIEWIKQQGREENLVAVQQNERLASENKKAWAQVVTLEAQVKELQKQIKQLQEARAAGLSRARRDVDI